MSGTHQHKLFGIVCCSLLQTVLAIHVFQRNGTNTSKTFSGQESNFIVQTLDEKLTTLDYYFFSYDIIDHITLLIKFDLRKTFLFQPNDTLYRACLYVSQLPSTNYKIDIGLFTGYYEKDLHGTITDHFTFCLVLTPDQRQNRMTNQTDTNLSRVLKSSSHEQRQQYMMHYCTKMGPDEDRHRHHVKQGSKGDRILLALQLMMIGIILAILQVVHVIQNRKKRTWRLRRLNRIRRELLHRKEYIEMPNETLGMLRFIPILDSELPEEIDDPEEEDEGEEEEEEEGGDEEDEVDSLILSHRRSQGRPLKYQHSRSPSPNADRIPVSLDASSVEHILNTKPWPHLPH